MFPSLLHPPIRFFIIEGAWRNFTQRILYLNLGRAAPHHQEYLNRLTAAFALLSRELEEDGWIMASKTRKNDKNDGQRDFKGFANVPFTADMREQFIVWSDETKDLEPYITTLMENGYKVSFAPDNDHKCVICTLTGNASNGHNSGYAMSSRAPDWTLALRVALYKHFVHCREDWSDYVRADDGDIWG